MIRAILILFFGLLISFTALSQHGTEKDTTFQRYRISMAIGHTFLPIDSHDGKTVTVLPSFGFDLEYWLNHRWGIGLHNDLELQIFEVEQQEGLLLEREYPVLLTFDVLFRVVAGLTLYAGPGVELERNHNYYVTRFGLEYEIHFGDGWDVHPSIFHDLRRNAYDTYAINLGIGKRF